MALDNRTLHLATDRLTALFDGKVGAPFSHAELADRRTEAEKEPDRQVRRAKRLRRHTLIITCRPAAGGTAGEPPALHH